MMNGSAVRRKNPAREKHLSLDKTAEALGVSSATIRNWVKAGYLNAMPKHPLSFLEESVLKLKRGVVSRSLSRLTTRANKMRSQNRSLPGGHSKNSKLIQCITDTVTCLRNEAADIELIMYLATLRFLETKSELRKVDKSNSLLTEPHFYWRRSSIKTVMLKWRDTFGKRLEEERINKLCALIHTNEDDDFLGLLYESLSKEGDKANQGSYYTPTQLVCDALAQIETPVETFLDPCCGTGKYLLLAAKKFDLKPENVFGVDSDPIAANIARINLLLAFKEKEFSPNIWCLILFRSLPQVNHNAGQTIFWTE
jgi:hypothetical protein